MTTLSPQASERRRKLLAASVFLIFLYFMLWQVNFYLAESVKHSYYSAFVPVLIAGTLYFGGLRRGIEYKLVLGYWLWYILTRILCGDRALSYEYMVCLDMSLLLPCLLLGLVLNPDERRRFLDAFSGAVGGYYFVIGLLSLYAFVTRRLLINPITEGALGIHSAGRFERITIMDINVDTTACWFMMAVFLMVYQFFACRNKLWRIPIVLAGLVYYAVISITYTRSVKLSLSLCLALLLVLLAHRRLKLRKKGWRILLLTLVFLLSTPLLYKSHTLITDGLGRLSLSILAAPTPDPSAIAAQTAEDGAWVEAVSLTLSPAPDPEETAEPSPTPQIGSEVYTDTRYWNGDLNHLSSGRIDIYKSAFYSIGRDPMILLRGSLLKDYMNYATEYLPRPQVHFQNYLLEVMILTGLPGVLSVLAFTFLIVVKGLKVFFSRDETLGLAERCLALPVAAILIYGMFERCIFSHTDEISLYFFIIVGFLLAVYNERYPAKN